MAIVKITKKDNFSSIRKILVDNDAPTALIDFIDHEVELLEKKSASRKPSKAQTVTTELREIVEGILSEATAPLTISEIQSADDRLKIYNGEPVSNQRVSAILTKMIAEGIVFKKVDHRKNYYAIAGIIDEEVENA